MLISIHTNHKIHTPEGVNGKGLPYSPFIVFRMGSGVTLKIYGGDAGMAGLKALLAQISDLVASGVTDLMPLRGIEAKGDGFVGFVPTFRFRPATQAEVDRWSSVETDNIGLAWQQLAAARAANAAEKPPVKASATASKDETVVTEAADAEAAFPF
jgi:hypothetical protein